MTFKLASQITFPWPVRVMEPDPDNAGKKIERAFTAVFTTVDPDEEKASLDKRMAILKRASAPDLKARELRAIQAELEAHDRAALRRVLTGWRDDILGEDDRPLPFSEGNFDRVYRLPHVRAALLRAYREAIIDEGGRLGN